MQYFLIALSFGGCKVQARRKGMAMIHLHLQDTAWERLCSFNPQQQAHAAGLLYSGVREILSTFLGHVAQDEATEVLEIARSQTRPRWYRIENILALISLVPTNDGEIPILTFQVFDLYFSHHA
jgi:hypothetical protein